MDSNLLDRETLKQMGRLKKDGDYDSESDTDEESEDEDEEEDEANEDGTGAKMDTLEGAAQCGERTTTIDMGVVFEDVDGKVNNADSVEGLSYPQVTKPPSPNRGGDVMGMLEELASGTQIEIPKTDLDSSLLTHSDHNYFISITPSRPGDTGDINQAVESKQTPTDSVSVVQDDGKLKMTSGSQQRPAPRNPTMKCLASSQSSFTKWLLAQGHYAPGICGKGRIINLQDNIVFSAFTLKLRPTSVNSTTAPDQLYQTNHCTSLFEYLIRPCKKFTGMETFCRSPERSLVLYLQELLTAKYINQEKASIKTLTER